ncbi:hypothetical protein MHB40_15085 [Lysinibacillus sp. FSL K6-0057]|uniref:hypothetical protein n=1 Tax=Lysinibacillus sp. FSL K6-0057 TaxID=2921411 RepID=UPI00315AC8C8
MKIKDYTTISTGLGFLLQLPFADNGVVSYKRPYLVIGEENNFLLLLNVSSSKGKEHKLLLDSNEEIIKYKPPFKLKSFVKFDALYKVEKCPTLNKFILSQGQSLVKDELDRLIILYANYVENNKVIESIISEEELNNYQSI